MDFGPSTPLSYFNANGKSMIVSLNIPDHISFQMVYRLESKDPSETQLDPESNFTLLTSPIHVARNFRTVASYCGTAGAIKAAAKLLSGRRSLYLITRYNRVETAGWCYTGQCKHYKIEPNAVVVGPIWTSPKSRGKGFASKALQLALNEYKRKGQYLFYIDTEKKNHAAQRVFEKCGFGPPVALYFK